MLAMPLMTSLALAGPNVGAIVRPEGVVDVASDRIGEDAAELHTWVSAFARDETERGDAWFLEGRLQHHALFGEDIEAWYELSLGESGWNGRLGAANSPVRLRIGALRERWGKLDLLPVVDVLNPVDARTGPLAPAAWQRVTVPMAVVAVGTGKIRSETVVIPFAGADRIWLRDTDWSLVRQGMVTRFVGEARNWEGGNGTEDEQLWARILEGLNTEPDPSTRRADDTATNLSALPQALVANGEIAQRFEYLGPGFDVAVMAGLLRSSFPQAILDDTLRQYLIEQTYPGLETLAGIDGEDTTTPPGASTEVAALGDPIAFTWPRTTMVGLEASGLVGPLQLRGETGWFSHRVVRLPWVDATTRPMLAAGIGVDYVRGTTFQASVEARWQHLFDAPDRMVFSVDDQVQIAAGVRGTVAQDRVVVQVGGAYDISFAELLLRPSVAWRISDAFQAEVGAVILEGFFFEEPSSDLRESLRYPGGPGTFWSQNDSLTFAATWFL